DVRSGIPDLIEDGVNGFAVPVGDVAGFASRIELLARDPELRLRIAGRAYETVRNGYTVMDMANGYAALFERVWQESAMGAYRRPSGPINPPDWMRPIWKHHLPGA